MKKLMMTAAAIALAGVATASNVFDYKASVKYVDFKQVSVSGTKVWVKTVKSTTLKGYLVTPQDCACTTACAGREPGFLVLTSSLAKKYNKERLVKLMPANLLADMWTQKSILGNAKSASLEAQGYLFAGIGKNATFLIETTENGKSPIYGFGDLNVTEATKYLFGQANFNAGDGFIEPFLDAAGFGKAGYSSTAAPICGKGTSGYCLKSLSGSVIGGCYSCLANGLVEGWRCQGWDNEAIVTPAFEYDNEYFYNVISGTWSIKENTKIKAAELNVLENALFASDADTPCYGTASQDTAKLVKACGQKLQSDFSLATFDSDGAYPLEFVRRWFAAACEE